MKQTAENMLNGTDNLRKQYMDGSLTHMEYYTRIAEIIGASKRQVPVSQERIDASTDEHLNDIPLAVWDAMHPIIRSMAIRAGMIYWSKSETVSVLKTVAKI